LTIKVFNCETEFIGTVGQPMSVLQKGKTLLQLKEEVVVEEAVKVIVLHFYGVAFEIQMENHAQQHWVHEQLLYY